MDGPCVMTRPYFLLGVTAACALTLVSAATVLLRRQDIRADSCVVRQFHIQSMMEWTTEIPMDVVLRLLLGVAQVFTAIAGFARTIDLALRCRHSHAVYDATSYVVLVFGPAALHLAAGLLG